MQLVVARGDPPLGIDQIGPVGDANLVQLDRERADMEPDAKLARERLEASERRILPLGLGRLDHELGLDLHEPGILRRLNIYRATLGRAPDQLFSLVEIGRYAAPRAELDEPGTEASFAALTHVSLASANVRGTGPDAGDCGASASASHASSLPSRSSAA